MVGGARCRGPPTEDEPDETYRRAESPGLPADCSWLLGSWPGVAGLLCRPWRMPWPVLDVIARSTVPVRDRRLRFLPATRSTAWDEATPAPGGSAMAISSLPPGGDGRARGRTGPGRSYQVRERTGGDGRAARGGSGRGTRVRRRFHR